MCVSDEHKIRLVDSVGCETAKQGVGSMSEKASDML